VIAAADLVLPGAAEGLAARLRGWSIG
jgi:hypothetical protein